MKVHYINILLFALPLNILEHNKNEPHTTPNHTQTTRSLCECKLYSPTNYDSDPEMKRVMQQFEDRTSQRFHEYDERMKTTRQKCKDKCDKESQKIILKDKLEKQMVEQFSTLQTDIQSDSIPTCICEKSLEDKMEKECLKCAQNLGGIVAPSTGVLGEIAALAVNAWKTTEIAAAIAAAKQAGAAMGKAAGDAAGATEVIKLMKTTFYINELNGKLLESVFNVKNYADASVISGFIETEYSRLVCGDIWSSSFSNNPFCYFVNEGIGYTSRGSGLSANDFIKTTVQTMVSKVKGVADTEAARVTATKTAAFEAKNIAAVEATTTPYYTPIIVSIVAIVVIVLIMVTIYLILRYLRKKKMKKKLQYIKLLEE
ncbi:surface antigen [Plasmodium falciparum UGT5.1]|uniref:Surface antigen n=1 Tax=Plasmodium falciparum UGT5.1 TaxID=1237627 RepID=W7JF55_PLAFA|nr:surface antigen [Plasmodium falciparum UGT5.1]